MGKRAKLEYANDDDAYLSFVCKFCSEKVFVSEQNADTGGDFYPYCSSLCEQRDAYDRMVDANLAEGN